MDGVEGVESAHLTVEGLTDEKMSVSATFGSLPLFVTRGASLADAV